MTTAASLRSVLARPLLLAVVCVGGLLISGCGEADQPPATSVATASGEPTSAEPSPTAPRAATDATVGERPAPQRERGGARRAATGAADAYRAYIDAINGRDGQALCALLAPGATRELQAPVERGSCAATLAASIGYRDPRGFPVWRRTRLNTIERTQVAGDLSSARITAAIVTDFADRNEPSVESDIAYLERAGGRWRLAKPSSALYRALGNAEPPPDVIAPPQG